VLDWRRDVNEEIKKSWRFWIEVVGCGSEQTEQRREKE
jgi:hypothetical protein